MSNTYQSIGIDDSSGGSGGSGGVVFESTFTTLNWSLNVDQYELNILETTHELGSEILVQVEELVGSFYQEVDAVVQNNSGNIKIIVGNDSRFTGRVLIKG